MKTLILYTFHNNTISNNRTLQQLMKHVNESQHLLIIINNMNLTIHIKKEYVTFINRENKGYDFGAWGAGLSTINIDDYKYYIFINGSAGCLQLTPDWTDNYTNKLDDTLRLFGSTINCMDDPINKAHIQTYIFSMEASTVKILLDNNIFNINNDLSMKNVINNYEIKMSRIIIDKGYNIGCLMNIYKNIDFRFLDKKLPMNIKFYNDIHHSNSLNILWSIEEVIFFKYNRISYNIVRYIENKPEDQSDPTDI